MIYTNFYSMTGFLSYKLTSNTNNQIRVKTIQCVFFTLFQNSDYKYILNIFSPQLFGCDNNNKKKKLTVLISYNVNVQIMQKIL